MPDDATEPTPLLVACLCAAWCLTCEAYRGPFEAMARAHPAARFVWVDIEDQADALDVNGDAPDIENFPTLLLVQDGRPRFFGSVLPHASVLERLLAEAERGALPPLRDAPSLAMARAVSPLR